MSFKLCLSTLVLLLCIKPGAANWGCANRPGVWRQCCDTGNDKLCAYCTSESITAGEMGQEGACEKEIGSCSKEANPDCWASANSAAAVCWQPVDWNTPRATTLKEFYNTPAPVDAPPTDPSPCVIGDCTFGSISCSSGSATFGSAGSNTIQYTDQGMAVYNGNYGPKYTFSLTSAPTNAVDCTVPLTCYYTESDQQTSSMSFKLREPCAHSGFTGQTVSTQQVVYKLGVNTFTLALNDLYGYTLTNSGCLDMASPVTSHTCGFDCSATVGAFVTAISIDTATPTDQQVTFTIDTSTLVDQQVLVTCSTTNYFTNAVNTGSVQATISSVKVDIDCDNAASYSSDAGHVYSAGVTRYAGGSMVIPSIDGSAPNKVLKGPDASCQLESCQITVCGTSTSLATFSSSNKNSDQYTSNSVTITAGAGTYSSSCLRCYTNDLATIVESSSFSISVVDCSSEVTFDSSSMLSVYEVTIKSQAAASATLEQISAGLFTSANTAACPIVSYDLVDASTTCTAGCNFAYNQTNDSVFTAPAQVIFDSSTGSVSLTNDQALTLATQLKVRASINYALDATPAVGTYVYSTAFNLGSKCTNVSYSIVYTSTGGNLVFSFIMRANEIQQIAYVVDSGSISGCPISVKVVADLSSEEEPSWLTTTAEDASSNQGTKFNLGITLNTAAPDTYNFYALVKSVNGEQVSFSQAMQIKVINANPPAHAPYFKWHWEGTATSLQSFVVNVGDTAAEMAVYKWPAWTSDFDRLVLEPYDKGFFSLQKDTLYLLADKTQIPPNLINQHFSLELYLINEANEQRKYMLPVAIVNLTFAPPTEVVKMENEVEKVEQENATESCARCGCAWLCGICCQGNARMKIREFTQFGEVYIKFSQEINPNFDKNLINKTSLNIQMVPDGAQTSQGVDWVIDEVTPYGIKLKLNFTNPKQISPNIEQDRLQIRFTGAQYLLKEKNNANKMVMNDNNLLMTSKIPRQLPDTQFYRTQEKAAMSAESSLKFLLIVAILFQVMGSAAGRFFFLLARTLQLIVHLPMLSIVMPATIMMCWQNIIRVCMFDILDEIESFDWEDYPTVFRFDYARHEELRSHQLDQAEDLGYDSHNSVMNLETLFFVLVFYFAQVALFIVIGIVHKYVWTSNGRRRGARSLIRSYLRKGYQFLKNSLFFDAILITSMEAYMEFLIVGFLQVREPMFNPYGERYSFLLGVFCFAVAYLALPILSVWLCRQNIIGRLQEDVEFKRRWSGGMLEYLRNTDRLSKLHNVMYCSRRIAFVLVCLLLSSHLHGTGQLLVILNLNLAALVYYGQAKAYQLTTMNRLDVFNEACVCFSTLHLLFFTDWVIDQDLQERYGYSLLAGIFVCVAVNVFFMLRAVVRSLRLSAIKYARLAKFKMQQARAWRQAQQLEKERLLDQQKKKEGKEAQSHLVLLKRRMMTATSTQTNRSQPTSGQVAGEIDLTRITTTKQGHKKKHGKSKSRDSLPGSDEEDSSSSDNFKYYREMMIKQKEKRLQRKTELKVKRKFYNRQLLNQPKRLNAPKLSEIPEDYNNEQQLDQQSPGNSENSFRPQDMLQQKLSGDFARQACQSEGRQYITDYNWFFLKMARFSDLFGGQSRLAFKTEQAIDQEHILKAIEISEVVKDQQQNQDLEDYSSLSTIKRHAISRTDSASTQIAKVDRLRQIAQRTILKQQELDREHGNLVESMRLFNLLQEFNNEFRTVRDFKEDP